MKNFILATVSSFALISMGEAHAQETHNQQTPGAAPSMTMEQKAPPEIMKLRPAPVKPNVRAHKKHHHHHHHKHHHAQLERDYITFPPIDAYGRVRFALAYYLGNLQCPYQYHGGYFWYPHLRGDILERYTPYYDNRMYWYPSRMHPHMVYVDRTPIVYVYPHPMDAPMYDGRAAPMQKKWESAPGIRTVEEY